MEEDSSDFKKVADSVFETFLTITTILSGIYVAIFFGWFGQAMIEPHPGAPITLEMLTQSMMGIFLGMIFIFPLVVILMAWAISRFKNSLVWRTMGWSGLMYLLTQDFIGIAVLLAFPLFVSGGPIGLELILVGAVVVLPPPTLGSVLGYQVGIRYFRSVTTMSPRRGRTAISAVLAVVAILIIQGSLLAFLSFYMDALYP